MEDSQSKSPDNITISTMQAEHLDDLADLESSVFSRPWSYDALAEELQNPLAVFYVADFKSSKQAVGYMGMHHILDEGAVSNIVIHPKFRRRGIASALMQRAVEYAKKCKITRLTLEVRVSNAAAIAFYEGFGFERDGIRPGFYDSPKEDAAIYSLYI